MSQLQFIGRVKKRVGRSMGLDRSRGLKHGVGLLTYTTRQANRLTTQLSREGQANMPNSLTIYLHISGIIGPQSDPNHRSTYSMSRFLDMYSEAPWTPEARQEAHNYESRLTEFSILQSSLLTITGSPIQEPPSAADMPASSDHPSEPYTQGRILASKIESDGLTRFLDPRSEAPWTPEDLGRREKIAENLWISMLNELLCGDEEWWMGACWTRMVSYYPSYTSIDLRSQTKIYMLLIGL